MIEKPHSPDDAAVSAAGWEADGWIEVDAATIGIGDPSGMALGHTRLLDVDRELGSERPVQDFTQRGIQLITMGTGEDAPYPVEVMRDGGGTLRMVRVELTNDVSEVVGRWRSAGRIEVTSGSIVVADPYCEGHMYSAVFPAPNGRYVVEVFEMHDGRGKVVDHLGIRARFEKGPSMPKRRMTLSVTVPPYPAPAGVRQAIAPARRWRDAVYEAIIQAAQTKNIEYGTFDDLEVELTLYMTESQLRWHDVDNMLKHVFDALQGRLGGSKATPPKPAPVPNDHQIQKVCVEKRLQTTSKLKSRLVVRGKASTSI